jgi:protein ECT2
MSRPYSPQSWDMMNDEEVRRPPTITQASYDVRPRGPRAPSPLPSSRTPEIRIHDLPSEEDITISEETILQDLTRMSGISKGKGKTAASSPLPRSRRQQFDPSSGVEMTPKTPVDVSRTLSVIEPLSIKRKTSANTLNGHRRRVHNVGRGSPMTKPQSRVTSLTRHTSAQFRPMLRASTNMLVEEAQQLVRQSETAQEAVRTDSVSVLHRSSRRMLRLRKRAVLSVNSDSTMKSSRQPLCSEPARLSRRSQFPR